MKVIYEKSMVEKIKEAKKQAEKAGKAIEKIILSPKELQQLKGECVIAHPMSWESPLLGLSGGEVLGVLVEVESLMSCQARANFSKECWQKFHKE